MLKFITGVAFVLCCSFGLATQSFAQQVDCKEKVQATGHGALLERSAKDKAVEAWRNAVVTQYGVFYGDNTQANEGKGLDIVSCGRTLLGLDVCLASGKPCQVSKSDNAATKYTMKCEAGRDSKTCDETTKWLQDKLNKLGYGLVVDGAYGPATGSAIAKYRKKAGIPDSASIEDVFASLDK